MSKELKNIAVSVKERLRNLSLQSGTEFQFLVRQFIQERFLYRLSKSKYANKLILKGALLFLAHEISRNRPTKDIDLHGNIIVNDAAVIRKIISEIISTEASDGLKFDNSKISVEQIMNVGGSGGFRIKFNVYLENSKNITQIDIGFGDVITNGPHEIDFPVLLDFPQPRIKVYSIESAVAEKLEAIISLMLVTSRMKDFYDIIFLASKYEFKKHELRSAINDTFNNRGTVINHSDKIIPKYLGVDIQLQKYWEAFLIRSKLNEERNFAKILGRISDFIEPVFSEENGDIWDCNQWRWTPPTTRGLNVD